MIPQTSLNSLEFNKLLEIIARHAHSDASEKAILAIAPLSRKEDIEKRFSCIEDILLMSNNDTPLSVLPFKDIEPVLQKVRPEDAIPEPYELAWLMDFFQAVHEASAQIRKDASLIALNELTADLTDRKECLGILSRSIDREGNVLDTASPELAELRAEKKRLETRVRKRLEEIVRDEETAKFMQDSFISQRSGRWVIPVRMDSKGQVPGVVHDVSRTGETAFVEPIAIIGLSNEYENIVAEEKAEVMRILRGFGAMIREAADGIEADFRIMVSLDVLNSIAMTARQFRMFAPRINEENVLHLVKARHPLLLHAALQKGKGNDIVPIDVHLGRDKIVMVITGPNAGGKTVAIKTIGLLFVMALSGIPIPADSSTTIPLFQNLLVDIGDRQSIEDNLSTFTAHLSNMMEFVNKADSATLVLIDEMGTGTDPEEGAALACAILKELKKKSALIFATTHLMDIKVAAHREDGMVNASMEFDSKTLMPLYRLRSGEPGQSFALETAERYGLRKDIIESARALLGRQRADLENLIKDLDQKRRSYEEAFDDLKKKTAELEKREEGLDGLLKGAEAGKKEIISNAYKEASGIIADVKREMNILLEEFKKRDREKAKGLLKEAALLQKGVEEKIKEYEIETEPVSMDELKEGDVVFVKSLGYDTSIVKLLKKKKRLKVKAGSMEMEVPLSDVGVKKGKIVEARRRDIKPDVLEPAVAAEVNLIGLRVDEALSKLEQFLNDATLAGLSEVVIIHGIGTWALAKAVREHLSEHPLVKSYRVGEQTEGGGGGTVVALK